MKKRYIVLILLIVGIFACKKEIIKLDPIVPDGSNSTPYDSIDYSPNDPPPVNVDPNSIVGIHQNIFLTRCALAGCHDGAFEPDYRTVQSAYTTLVYHTIIKNNTNGDFYFRVIPGDKENSVLYERITNCCFVNVDDMMPQDFTGQLPQDQIDNIGKWIDDGAKDIFGTIPGVPTPRPVIFNFGMLAYQGPAWPDTMKVSDNRLNNVFTNPFIVPDDTLIDIWFDIRQFIPNGDTILGNDPRFTNMQIAFSEDLENFSNPTTVNLDIAQTPFDIGFLIPNFHFYVHYMIDTTPYDVGDIVYFRVYISDQSYTDPTEIPDDNSREYLKTYLSFILQ
ncbi:MAG: hypothetical protein IH946_10495 [Bacteroidetes bacterium]|nr:hypothetical protein [Bacteroidota bacterium]